MQAYDYELRPYYEYDNCMVQSEQSRPMPITILHQQGIHPHPGPDAVALTSIISDECWEQWGMTSIAEPADMLEPNVDEGVVAGAFCYQHFPPVVGTRIDDSDDSLSHRSDDDGFTDWYGDKSSVDHLCRGRYERVLGTEMIDEAAFFGQPPSLLQIALSSGAESSVKDPSCNKLCRNPIGDPVDELHQAWVDELSLATPSTCPAGQCGAWEVTSMFVSHALPGSSTCDYGDAGTECNDGDDDVTCDLVEKFLGGGQLAATTASTEDWSRNSRPMHVCARFRAATGGGRPGREPEEAKEAEEPEEADDEAEAAEEAQAPPGIGGEASAARQVQRQYASVWHPLLPPFSLFPTPQSKTKIPPPLPPHSPRYGSNACSAPTLAEEPHHTPLPMPSAAFKANPALAADQGKEEEREKEVESREKDDDDPYPLERGNACKNFAGTVPAEKSRLATAGVASEASPAAARHDASRNILFEGRNYAEILADPFQGKAEEIQAGKCHGTCDDASRAGADEHDRSRNDAVRPRWESIGH